MIAEKAGKLSVNAPLASDTWHNAQNLVTNLEKRTSGNNNMPLIDGEGTRTENYEACFYTSKA